MKPEHRVQGICYVTLGLMLRPQPSFVNSMIARVRVGGTSVFVAEGTFNVREV